MFRCPPNDLVMVLMVFIVGHAVFPLCSGQDNEENEKPVDTSGRKTFNVILIVTKDNNKQNLLDFDHLNIAPAVILAARRCEERHNLHLNVIHRFYTDGCSQAESLGLVTNSTNTMKHIVAIVGPACSLDLKNVAYYASHRKIPVVTGLGGVLQDNRDEYNTLIRTAFVVQDQVEALVAILDDLKLRRVGCIKMSDNSKYNIFAEMFEEKAEKAEIFIKKTVEWSDKKDMLSLFSMKLKVIILFMPVENVRKLLLTSEFDRMQKRGSSFFYSELHKENAMGNYSWAGGNENYATKMKLKKKFQSVFILSLKWRAGKDFAQFKKNLSDLAVSHYSYKNTTDVTYFTAAFYDAVLLLCNALVKVLKAGGNVLDGNRLVNEMKESHIDGMSGNVTINKHGDRIADYELWFMDRKTGLFETVYYYHTEFREIRRLTKIDWPFGELNDRLGCDVNPHGKECQPQGLPNVEITFSIAFACTAAAFVLGSYMYRKIQLERGLRSMSWRVMWNDITFQKGSPFFTRTVSRSSRRSRKSTREAMTSVDDNVSTGVYKGNIVAIKILARHKQVELTRGVRKELKKVREARHVNIVVFVGVCLDPPYNVILTEYCIRGNLQDVLKNHALHLDWAFRYSLINDIVMGMCYIHSGEIRTHGRLRSTNCLVDSRFVVKLSDFGLPSLRNRESYLAGRPDYNKKLLWKAPELLRLMACPSEGTQEGDVYSFGIILQEIAVRDDPFYPFRHTMSVNEILEAVIDQFGTPFRPDVPKECCSSRLLALMERCWTEFPDDRPVFNSIRGEIRYLNRRYKSTNIMDSLLCRMEQYATNLEALAVEKTNAFIEQKKNAEQLLYQLLPVSVAEKLKRGEYVEPQLYEAVTIYFAEIVDFTTLCSSSLPYQIVDLMNDMYYFFDATIEYFDAYKVDVIGDLYVVVSGLPIENGIQHAAEIAHLSQAMIARVKEFQIRHRPDEQLQLRIGIHTGPCCAGVLGLTMPRYCIFGDTVNTASRMETNGQALKIHVSDSSHNLLEIIGGFTLTPRHKIAVKGKGMMQTYWLEESETILKDFEILGMCPDQDDKSISREEDMILDNSFELDAENDVTLQNPAGNF